MVAEYPEKGIEGGYGRVFSGDCILRAFSNLSVQYMYVNRPEMN